MALPPVEPGLMAVVMRSYEGDTNDAGLPHVRTCTPTRTPALCSIWFPPSHPPSRASLPSRCGRQEAGGRCALSGLALTGSGGVASLSPCTDRMLCGALHVLYTFTTNLID